MSRMSAKGGAYQISQGEAMAQGGAISDRPCPWNDNEKRFPSTHWLTMGLGGAETAAPWVEAARWTKEGRYLIALAHEGTMKSGSDSLTG